MINFDCVTGENAIKYNSKSRYIPFRILIIRLRIIKKNALLNLIKLKDDDDYVIIDKIYLSVKDENEAKYQYLTRKREKISLYCYKNAKALIEYSNNMDDIYIDDYNIGKEHEVIIVFHDLIANMISNKKLNPNCQTDQISQTGQMIELL